MCNGKIEQYPSLLKKAMEEKRISNRHAKFINSAREAAMHSNFDGPHIGCVLTYHNKIIGTGFNSKKTDPIQKKYNAYRPMVRTRSFSMNEDTLHAEIAALKSVGYVATKDIDWNHVDAYIFRISVGLEFGQGLAKPCKACMKALTDIGVKSIWFTENEGYTHMIK